MPTYLYILNDKWFDVNKLISDTNGEFYLTKKPKRVAKNDRVYLYLSGGTKAVKYEMVVTDASLTWGEVSFDFSKYFDKPEYFRGGISEDKQMVKLKILREIKNLEKTSPKALKEEGNILGTLMSNRELRPYSIEYLNSVK